MTDQQRVYRTIEYNANALDSAGILIAPPVLLQSRKGKTIECPNSVLSTKTIKHIRDSTIDSKSVLTFSR